MIENVTFTLGQRVCLAIDPTWKGIVIGIMNWADGGCQYELSHLTPDGSLINVKCFSCELDAEDY